MQGSKLFSAVLCAMKDSEYSDLGIQVVELVNDDVRRAAYDPLIGAFSVSLPAHPGKFTQALGCRTDIECNSPRRGLISRGEKFMNVL